MHKTTARNNRHYRSHYNLENDIKNIKSALADTSYDVTGRIGEILSHSAQDLKDKSIDARDYAADYISEKPFKSLGIALLVGFVLGFLVRR